jgi:hypothetical protein
MPKRQEHFIVPLLLAKVLVRMKFMVDRRDNCGSESALYHALHALGHDDNFFRNVWKMLRICWVRKFLIYHDRYIQTRN